MRKKGHNTQKRKDMAWGYGMILPLFLGLAVFYFYPVVKVIYDSFFNVGAFDKRTFAGLENYKTMIADAAMWKSLGNTFLYVALIVPFTVILALILAELLNQKMKGRDVFRVIYFIPTVTMTVAIAMMWRWIFNGDFGILNHIVGWFGGSSHYWLSEKPIALICVGVVSIWMGIGLNMIILLAGIQGISASYYEAAKIDGASPVRRFFSITVPLITPSLFFVLTTTLISTLQIFDVIYMMIAPKSTALVDTQSVVMYFFRNAFEYSKKGYASAIAVLLFVIIMAITALQMKLQRKWVNYD